MPRPTTAKGFTLLETLVAIGLIVTLLAVFSATLNSVLFQRRGAYRFQANNLVREGLDAMRSLPYADLVNQTNGPLLGLAVNRGGWAVLPEASAPSAEQVIELPAAASPAVNSETGVLVVPTSYHDDFTFAAKLRVRAASPSGWGVAVAFRYRDAANHYRFRLTSGGYALDKVYRGATTTLWQQSAVISKDTWYALEVVASDTSLTVRKDGATLTTVTDSTFAAGDLALLSLNGALVQADDLAVSGGGETGGWDFDDDAPGALPTTWQRFSYFDLPNGHGAATIADYEGITDLKQITVTATWNEPDGSGSVTGTTIISKP